MVSAAPAGRCVEIEHHGIVRGFEHTVEQAAQILLAELARDREAVDLEHAYAVVTVQAYDVVGILLPVGEIVLYAGVVPEAHLYAQAASVLHHGTQAAGIFLRVGLPVVAVAVHVAERALRHGRVGALAHLPAVVYLKEAYAKARGSVKLRKAERLVHLCVLRPVAPGVHHHHLVARGVEYTRLLLIAAQGLQRFRLRAVVGAEHRAVSARPAVGRNVLALQAQTGHGKAAEVGYEVGVLVS